MKRPIDFLKACFKTGMVPSQSNYYDWLDSYVHKDDLTQLNTNAFNQKLGQYDNELKSESAATTTKTLGDVLKALNNWPRGQSIADKIGATPTVAWANVSGKPASVPIKWTEQIVTLTPLSIPIGASGRGYGWVAQAGGITAGSAMLIVDIQVERKLTNPAGQIYTYDGISALKLAVNPFISLT